MKRIITALVATVATLAFTGGASAMVLDPPIADAPGVDAPSLVADAPSLSSLDVMSLDSFSLAAANQQPPGGGGSDPTITYTGQGFNDATGLLNTSLCGANADAGGGGTIPADGRYLLWVLSGGQLNTTAVTLHLPDGDHSLVAGGGQWKFVSAYWPVDVLTSLPVTATFSGSGSPDLKVSHGCAGVTAISSITTAVHLGSTDSATPTVVDDTTGAALGSRVHDSASLTTTPSGVAMPAASSVTFTLYPGNTCAGTALKTIAVDVSGQISPISLDPELASDALRAGEYSYQAALVSGNESVVKSSTGACEPFKINKAQLGITTTLHGADHTAVTEVPLGAVVHDTATLTGVVAGFDPGAVSFTLNGGLVASDNGNGGDPIRSVPSAPLAAGSYTYAASVAGNDNYIGASSGDESLTVDKAQLGITTQIHDASHGTVGGDTHVALGTVVHDTATVTGIVADFSIGDVSFTLNDSAVANDTTADGAATARSMDSAPLAAGSYIYAASVAGNDNYIGATSGDEPLTVDKARLTLSTAIHGPAHTDITGTHVPLGSTVHDTATLNGAVNGFTPTGAISFVSTGGLLTDQTNPAESGFAASTVDSGPLHAGSYSYGAVYAGDANYLPATTARPELLTVDKGKLTLTTEMHNAVTEAVVANGDHLPLGSNLHDTAQLSGAVAGFDPPSTSGVVFKLNGVDAGRNDGTGADAIRSQDSGPLGAGSSYKYVATLAGNSNYEDAASADEPFIVDKAQLAITTQIHGGTNHTTDITGTHVPLGTVVHDSAQVTGGVAGFHIPDISFTLNGTAVAQGSTGDAIRTVDSGPLHAGGYTYKASVGSDSNYIGADSADEALTVDRATVTITTVIHSARHGVVANGSDAAIGVPLHDTAQVTGAVAGFPVSVSFALNGTGIGSDNGDVDAIRSVEVTPQTAGHYSFTASVTGTDYVNVTSAPEPFDVGLAWCSPGFWKNAAAAAWPTGYSKTSPFNSNANATPPYVGVAPSFYPTLSANPTLGDVLSKGANFYGPTVNGLNPFNAVGAFLTSKLSGWTWNGSASGSDRCPVNNAGVPSPIIP